MTPPSDRLPSVHCHDRVTVLGVFLQYLRVVVLGAAADGVGRAEEEEEEDLNLCELVRAPAICCGAPEGLGQMLQGESRWIRVLALHTATLT